jgi:hypothetical protein
MFLYPCFATQSVVALLVASIATKPFLALRFAGIGRDSFPRQNLI